MRLHSGGRGGSYSISHGRMCERFPAGPGTFNDRTVLVSRGVGGFEVPIRLYAPPDIVLIDLERPSRAAASPPA